MTMTSLITHSKQMIQPNTLTAIRFDEESSDIVGWHSTNSLSNPNSALITPSINAVGLLSGMVWWESPWSMTTPPTQFYYRFARDPYGNINTTANHDIAPTPGGQYHIFTWPISVHDGEPLALMVNHDGSDPLAVTLAEFKVWVP
jgi:hypothetical protein